MEPSVLRSFGESLARWAIERDWERVRELLAPWLRARFGASDVQAFFERDYARTLSLRGVRGLHHPQLAEVSDNSVTLAYLRTPPSWKPSGRAIPVEVNDANFRRWMKIQLQCSDSQADELRLDYLSDVWLIVVELEEGLRVGYWCHDPDGDDQELAQGPAGSAAAPGGSAST